MIHSKNDFISYLITGRKSELRKVAGRFDLFFEGKKEMIAEDEVNASFYLTGHIDIMCDDELHEAFADADAIVIQTDVRMTDEEVANL